LEISIKDKPIKKKYNGQKYREVDRIKNHTITLTHTLHAR
jgi:hypothetical protein